MCGKTSKRIANTLLNARKGVRLTRDKEDLQQHRAIIEFILF
jgi:hypothetical protein